MKSVCRICSFFALFALSFLSLSAQQHVFLLDKWQLQYPDPTDSSGFNVSVETAVPGCIHTDLFSHHIIPDPFYGTNEADLQWIGETPCEYHTYFWKQDFGNKKHPELVMEGVTGYAEIFLNGQPLLHQDGNNVMDNSYRTWHFSLDGLVRPVNELIVRFTPASSIIRQRASKLPYRLPDERAFLRTPPYQAGWDWGPKLVTCGMTGAVQLESWSHCKILQMNVHQQDLQCDAASLLVSIRIESDKEQTVTLSCRVSSDNQEENATVASQKVELYPGIQTVRMKLNIPYPHFWNPNGLGEQSLYTVTASVSKGRKRVEECEKRIGLRTIELRQQKDSVGSSFEWLVNGRPVFMKGVNWIPADFFPNNMDSARYRELLQACKDANMNMIRVWGGGIYEPDIFYDLCDELGLLVWQDFMFSCALYPGDSSFIKSVEEEAKDQVRRLRNHPCLAAWCGNNEVKNGWDDWGWKSEYSSEQQSEISKNIELLFEKTLKDVVVKHASSTPYISTSPLWGWGHPECCTEGDSHYWGVWWGEQPFEVWYDKTGRFMSEFGFQSYPDMATIQTVAPANEKSLESPSLQSHQKHGRGVQIINKAMEQYFNVPDSLEDYVYVSQLVQALGTGMALEEHRRRSPYCMGTLFWQLNDCWPVASWSCIDYYGRKKALYYEAKRKFAPVIIATAPVQDNRLPVYAVNDGLSAISASVLYEMCDFKGNVLSATTLDHLTISNSGAVPISEYVLPWPMSDARYGRTYLRIRLLNEADSTLAEKVVFFRYPGQLELTSSELSIKQMDANRVEVSSPYLQYGVRMDAGSDGSYTDNYFLLLPNEPKQILFVPKDSDERRTEWSARSYRN